MAQTTSRGTFLPPGPVAEGYPANLLLVYTGFYSLARLDFPPGVLEVPTDVARLDGGEWVPADFIPYVAHLDREGVPDDTFFDSFLFLGLRSWRGREFAGERGQDRASLWADWQWYLDRLFTPGKQLDALNTTVGAVADYLGLEDYTVNVYIMIPYPSYLVTDFGHPDGTMGGMSLLPVENRFRAVRWYVDEVIARWNAWHPARLRLAGFYWLQEHINPAVPDEERLVRDVVKYVQELGYRIGWIPWSGAMLATRWAEYGFDWAIIQPNHMFRDQPGMIETAVQRGRTYRMGIEIELDGRVRQADGERRLYDYLNGGVTYGYMREAMLGYYQDLDMMLRLYLEEQGRRRYMYDDLYEFAKGTYPEPTPAAAYVRGIVTDRDGNPVPSAKVESGGRIAYTDETGAFSLTGIYSAQAGLIIVAEGYDPLATTVATSRGGATEPYRFVLQPPTAVAIHTFDETTGLTAVGVGVAVVTEPKTEGDGAVLVTLRQGLLQSLRVPATQDRQDWSRGQVIALDVLPYGPVTLRLNLRDRSGNTYSRTFTPEPGVWQTLRISVADAAEGRYHEPLVAELAGNIDPARIEALTVAFTGAAGTQVYIDNLRLEGVGSGSGEEGPAEASAE